MPRYHTNYIDNSQFNYGWSYEEDVSQKIKDAVCEEAFAILKFGANANKRQELINQGVKSFNTSNLSETYNGTNTSEETSFGRSN